MLSILKERQNARIIILVPAEERTVRVLQWLADSLPARYNNEYLRADTKDAKQVQIVVGTIDEVRKVLRRLGPCDALIVDDCYNLAPIVGKRKYREISEYFKEKNPSLIVTIYKPAPLLGMAPIVKPKPGSWRCGENPVIVKIAGQLSNESANIHIEKYEVKEPCGAFNLEGQYICRTCGRFRGAMFVPK